MGNIDSDGMDKNVLEKVLALVYKHTGITMAENKKTLLQGRLRPRIRVLNLNSYAEYLTYLESHKDETQTFINLVTTNETFFFRTQRVWDYFNKELLPNWIKENPKKTLRIWSAAASTGAEIYSIGICCEEFRQKNPTFNFSLVGTDISTDVLKEAEKGEYQGRPIEGLKTSNPAMFEKYFKPSANGFKVSSDIQLKIRFAPHNLFQQYPQPNAFDIVFLRNVLIYFEPADTEKVLANISKALVDKGRLIIGESESLSSLKTTFKFVAPLVYENARG